MKAIQRAVVEHLTTRLDGRVSTGHGRRERSGLKFLAQPARSPRLRSLPAGGYRSFLFPDRSRRVGAKASGERRRTEHNGETCVGKTDQQHWSTSSHQNEKGAQ